MRVVLAGGSGALGRRLGSAFASKGAEVVVLTRSPRRDVVHRQELWDGRSVGDWAGLLSDAVVVNLAGEIVDRRPTRANIELLTRSRTEPTQALAAASRQLETPPRLWLQMSTLAIYGDAGEDVITESHPAAVRPPQMAGVARAWEGAAAGARAGRLVVMRTGVVLDPGTPAFNRLRTLTRWGLGGTIGNGRQWVSWIHIDDFLRAVDKLREEPSVAGTVHVTAPQPIRNRDMMRELRSTFRRPWSPPAPRAVVQLGAALMRTDPALALTGRRCVPEVLNSCGFQFNYPDFASAIRDLASRPPADAAAAG